MLNEDKQALLNGTARIRCKLIVKAKGSLPEIVLTEQNCVKDWIYNDDRYVPQQGFIGQFVARTLEGNLQDISDDFNIENREIELQLGIVGNNSGEPNWYSFGTFVVTDPEGNEVTDNTKFQAMDYTKLFNKRFDGDYTNSTYTASYNKLIETGSVTALWLAKYTCAQVGVDFPQTSFTNSDFSIKQNPFQAGESCRDVLKEVAKLAYSWVRIGWDDKCYIDFNQVSDSNVDIHNIVSKDAYYELETKKTIYGPINNVVVGMSGVDGESHSVKDQASITKYGEHTIYIYDNPLTNTFELRELAQQKANKLFGLNYVHLEVETVGHPWLQGNERINVLDMEDDNNFTYPFNKSLEYNGHIRSVINTMGESEVESTLAYESGFVKNIRNASLNVDKQNGKISALIEDVTEQNGIVTDKINNLQLDLNGTTLRVATVEKSVTDLEGDIDKKLGLISEDIDGVQINLDEFIDNEYAQGISNLQKQIDGAIQFWNGPEIPTLNNKPAKDWTTENDKINHQADIYTVIEDVAGELKQGKSYRFDKVNGKWVWIELTDNELSAVQAIAQEALDKARQNEGDVVTLKSDVSDLKQTDKEITASVDSIENTLVPTADVSGSNIVVNDSTDASLVKFKIEGKSTQETRSGTNKFNASLIPASTGIVVNEDGSQIVMPTITAGNGATYTGVKLSVYAPELKVGDTAHMYFERIPNVNINMMIYLNGANILWYRDTTKVITQEMLNSEVVLYGNRYMDGETEQVTLVNFRIVLGDSNVEWEQYGATPSPDYPSEIESVGYENLFDVSKITEKTAIMSADGSTATSSVSNLSDYIEVKANKPYTLSFEYDTLLNTAERGLCYYDKDKKFLRGKVYSQTGKKEAIAPTEDGYVRFSYDMNCYNIQVADGEHSYIPYGKSGIEVKTVGKNLLNVPEDYSVTLLDNIEMNMSAGTYKLSFDDYISTSSGASFLIQFFNSEKSISKYFYFKDKEAAFELEEDFTSIRIYSQSSYNGSIDVTTTFKNLMISKNGGEYQPYQEPRISLITLNAPLRSLPNGVKDIAYIKNNKLYVDRYIGSVVLNGSETIKYYSTSQGNLFRISNAILGALYDSSTNGNAICNHYIKSNYGHRENGKFYIYETTNVDIIDDRFTDADSFKTWLSTHNTQVDYELATPVTEEYGDINIPITYKNITNITTTDDLEPNMDITYVREGSMTDYIAGQFTEKDIIQSRKFSELSVKADSISASVTNVEGDLAETNTKVNTLETQITSQEATIKIVETHINKDDGTIAANEVTTSNGFTFNSQGLNIYVGENSYNTQINNVGTFYRDGDEIIGQTSKDGSILKDLKTQGQSQYSYDGDSYDFIEERVEVDGEYCYATFYNGEE